MFDHGNETRDIVESASKEKIIKQQAERIELLEKSLKFQIDLGDKFQAENARLDNENELLKENEFLLEETEHNLQDLYDLKQQTVQIAMLEKAVDTGVEAEEKLEAENQRLKELLIGSEPYSITHSIPILVKAIDHLMQDHSCDCHGYEVIETAKRSVMAWNVKAKGLLAAPPQKGQDNENTPTPTV